MVRESQDWFLITKNHGDRSLTPPTKCNNMSLLRYEQYKVTTRTLLHPVCSL